MDLAIHYVGVAEQIGLEDVHIDDGLVLALADGESLIIDLYPGDPGYLRVLASTPMPHPADPYLVVAEVTEQLKMVKARI